MTKKWPVRDSFKRKNSSSAIFRKSGDVYTFSSGEEMHRSFSGHYSHKKRNNQNGENLQTQTRKKTVELNRDDIKKNESFEIDEFELVMMEKPER